MASVPRATPQPDAIRRYNNVAVALHWLTAALIVVQLWLGWNFRGSDPGLQLFTWHKTLGVTILLLAAVRLAWRLTNPPPPYPTGFPRWERWAGAVNHWAFYLLLFALPLTGLTAVSDGAEGGVTRLIGGIPFPAIPGVSEATGERFGELHELLIFATLLLLALHVAAALKHQFWDRYEMSGRMPPFRTRTEPTVEG